VSETVSRINAISKEIAQDVRNVVISLQFHDITSQKLSGMLEPMDDLRRTLYHLMQETIGLDKTLLKNLPKNERWLSRLQEETRPQPDIEQPKETTRVESAQAPSRLRDGTDNGPAVELF